MATKRQLPPEKVFEDSELEEGSVIRNFLISATDSKIYTTKHYNLSAIIAVGKEAIRRHPRRRVRENARAAGSRRSLFPRRSTDSLPCSLR
jgi:hypothetical protein